MKKIEMPKIPKPKVPKVPIPKGSKKIMKSKIKVPKYDKHPGYFKKYVF